MKFRYLLVLFAFFMALPQTVDAKRRKIFVFSSILSAT